MRQSLHGMMRRRSHRTARHMPARRCSRRHAARRASLQRACLSAHSHHPRVDCHEISHGAGRLRATANGMTSPMSVTSIPHAAHQATEVLHVGKFYPPFRGGMETHLQLLCEELQDHLRVTVVVSSSTTQTVHECINGIHVHRLGTIAKLAGASISPGVRRFIADSPSAIVHIHLPNPTAVLAYFASGHDGPLVATYHSDIVRQRILGSVLSPLVERFLQRCDSIIVASPNYIESSPLLRKFRERCIVVPFGIDASPFDEETLHRSRELRRQYGPQIVLAVGRLVGYKGFEHLIDAMQRIDGRLLLVGNGPLRSKLEAQITRLGLENRVSLLGGVDDITPYHLAADVFVLPSVTRAEAFGLVQLEAMAASVPVVNTALNSGVPYVSLHENTGFTVPPGDSFALADAINRLLADDALRHRFGTAARARLESHFTVGAMVAQTVAVYTSILARRATAP